MTLRILFSTLLAVVLNATAMAQLVIDKKAIVTSTTNLAVSAVKGQQHKKVRDLTEDIYGSYTTIEILQQQVLDDLKQAETVSDLRWAAPRWGDLSKSLYLATELIQGAIRPGLEVDLTFEHPLFQRNPDDTYRDLFIADGASRLPLSLTQLQQAKQTSRSLASGLHQLTAERKAYAAVAFQYLAEDLIVKATEMNEVLKQSGSLSRPGVATPEFSMTEAERLRLQSFSEDYLLLAAQMLERSDQLLLDVTSVKPLQRQADEQQQRLERATLARTPVLNY